MRRTSRLLAAVKPAKYLEAGAPTGLTGLFTHAAPRQALIYIYSRTLDKLKQVPESSVYRQSTEALTKHRLKIINSVVPVGFEEWSAKFEKFVAENPDVFETPEGGAHHSRSKHSKEVVGEQTFVTTKVDSEIDDAVDGWDGDEDHSSGLVGTKSQRKRTGRIMSFLLGTYRPEDMEKKWDPQPSLSADQISDIENQIGAGLIEEVIQVAEGELKLVQVMAKAEVWEDLEEKPAEGQWTYFMRGNDNENAQAPAQTK